MQDVTATECVPGAANQAGWQYSSTAGTITNGQRCLDGANTNQVVATACTSGSGSASQKWDFDSATGNIIYPKIKRCLDVWNTIGPRVDVYACHGNAGNQKFSFAATNGGVLKSGKTCLGLAPVAPPPPPSKLDDLQLWAKPQANGTMAILLINSNDSINATGVEIDLAGALNMSASAKVTARNIWARKDVPGTFSGSISLNVTAKASVFMLLKPV